MNEEKALSREETRASVRYLTPAVDIYETDAGLTLVADVPGLNNRITSYNVCYTKLLRRSSVMISWLMRS